MTVGNLELPVLHPVAGCRIGTARAGLRKRGDRHDLCVFDLDAGTAIAGVFTQNAFRAAPVLLAERRAALSGPGGQGVGLLINAGNANAGTGKPGLDAARACCEKLAGLLGVEADRILPFSTGVIGQQLAVERIIEALPAALAARTDGGWVGAANAIMTTDTVPKGCSRKFEIDGTAVTITGICKGAGMIRPDMATMLAFVGTDAAIETGLLRSLLQQVVHNSFNSITVDGDTSTNDSALLFATGRGLTVDEANPERLAAFTAVLEAVFQQLAESIVRDAEGATKFVSICVEQARSPEEARQVAYTVAHSPLVKTALFASDPNWGRILAAVGRSAIVDLDTDVVDLYIGNVQIVGGGMVLPTYREEAGQEVFSRPEIDIRICLNRGKDTSRILTSDLSHDYVKINAEYRT